jgi:hypothetical protein
VVQGLVTNHCGKNDFGFFGLFTDAVSSLDYIVSNNRIINDK